MARRLRHYNFPDRRHKYDWTNWTDTYAWEIYRGEDYEVATESMRVNLHERAKSEGKKVRTMIVRDENGREGLRFQFFNEEPDSSRRRGSSATESARKTQRFGQTRREDREAT